MIRVVSLKPVHSSKLYHTFDQVLVISRGRAIYTGPGGFAPAEYLSSHGIPCPEGYNVADFLLDVASDPPASIVRSDMSEGASMTPMLPNSKEVATSSDVEMNILEKSDGQLYPTDPRSGGVKGWFKSDYKTTFLTQLEVLSEREWKILRR